MGSVKFRGAGARKSLWRLRIEAGSSIQASENAMVVAFVVIVLTSRSSPPVGALATEARIATDASCSVMAVVGRAMIDF